MHPSHSSHLQTVSLSPVLLPTKTHFSVSSWHTLRSSLQRLPPSCGGYHISHVFALSMSYCGTSISSALTSPFTIFGNSGARFKMQQPDASKAPRKSYITSCPIMWVLHHQHQQIRTQMRSTEYRGYRDILVSYNMLLSGHFYILSVRALDFFCGRCILACKLLLMGKLVLMESR